MKHVLVSFLICLVSTISAAQESCTSAASALTAIKQSLGVESGIQNLEAIYLISEATESDTAFAFKLFTRGGPEFQSGGYASEIVVTKQGCQVSQPSITRLAPLK